MNGVTRTEITAEAPARGGSTMVTKTGHQRISPDDETLVRNQPALTASGGTVWLIVGGLLAATGIAVLTPMVELALPGVAIGGIIVVTLLYAVMIFLRFAIPSGRSRLGLMAIDLLCIGLVALVCVTVITAVEWDFIA